MAQNYFGLTDKGLVRANNEDTFIAKSVMNEKFVVACVIDGVGGYEGGEVAAKLAQDTIDLQLNELPLDNLAEYLKITLLSANEIIYSERQLSESNSSMACVLTLVVVDNEKNKFYYAHVGDTRLYLLRDGSLIKVTNDHSFVGFLEDKRKITEEDAMKHPKRNEINKALGFETDISHTNYIDTGDSPFLPEDVLLICSDGLTDMVDTKKMVSILTKAVGLQNVAQELIEAANEAGGIDNITVVLVKNENTTLQQQATKPTRNINEKSAVVSQLKANEIDYTNEKNKKNALPIFIFLIILLITTFGWIIYLNYKKSNDGQMVSDHSLLRRNDAEKLLVESINNSKTKEVFILNQEGDKPIVLTDSIFVNKDSLIVKGNGVTLKRDTSYVGPALTLSSNCKYIFLDSLTLENFDIGILARGPVLYLHNVHFINCKVPVQYNFIYTDKSNNIGKIADSVFYNAETKLDHP